MSHCDESVGDASDRSACRRERDKARKKDQRSEQGIALADLCARTHLSPADVRHWETVLSDEVTIVGTTDVGRNHEDGSPLLYHGLRFASLRPGLVPYTCAFCSGQHKSSSCHAAQQAIAEFDQAMSRQHFVDEFGPNSTSTLDRLFYVYRVHFRRAWKPVSSGFVSSELAVKALSPLIEELPAPTNCSLGMMHNQYIVRGPVWMTADAGRCGGVGRSAVGAFWNFDASLRSTSGTAGFFLRNQSSC